MAAPQIQTAEELDWLSRVERFEAQYLDIRERFEALKKTYITVSIERRHHIEMSGAPYPWPTVANNYKAHIEDAEGALSDLQRAFPQIS